MKIHIEKSGQAMLYTNTHRYTKTRRHTDRYTNTHTDIHTYANTHLHKNTFTHIHTHIHTLHTFKNLNEHIQYKISKITNYFLSNFVQLLMYKLMKIQI